MCQKKPQKPFHFLSLDNVGTPPFIRPSNNLHQSVRPTATATEKKQNPIPTSPFPPPKTGKSYIHNPNINLPSYPPLPLPLHLPSLPFFALTSSIQRKLGYKPLSTSSPPPPLLLPRHSRPNYVVFVLSVYILFYHILFYPYLSLRSDQIRSD